MMLTTAGAVFPRESYRVSAPDGLPHCSAAWLWSQSGSSSSPPRWIGQKPRESSIRLGEQIPKQPVKRRVNFSPLLKRRQGSRDGRNLRFRISAMGTTTQVKEGVELKVYETVMQLGEDLAPYVAGISKSAVETRGAFSIVLSGGSLISTLGKLTEEPYLGEIDWSQWHVFWADERVVPLDHPDSNYKLALDGLLSKVPIPPANVYALNDKLSPPKAAEDYETVLKQLVAKKVLPLDAGGNYPRFDLIFLGMGPDGHLASLFPKHALVWKTDSWVASIEDSPKPPPERITLTLPVINAAENVAFVATGSGKADKLKLIFGEDLPFGELPAKLVSPLNGKLVWFTDKDAVAKL